jgi:hypothetical protein
MESIFDLSVFLGADPLAKQSRTADVFGIGLEVADGGSKTCQVVQEWS